MAPLPQTALQVISLTGPSPTSNRVTATLLPSSPSTLNDSTSLSFEFCNAYKEVFVPRLSYRDLDIQDDGSVIATLGEIPRLWKQEVGEINVKVHIWKGEKLLGSWDVGQF